MNYKLAKELKEAGFPEPENWHGKYAYCLGNGWEHTDCREESQLIHDDNDEGCLVGNDYDHRFKENTWLYNPTLSELIEACGEAFGALIREKNKDHNGWLCVGKAEAYMGGIDEGTVTLPTGEHRGSTPEEAVARLWLALNKK